MAVDSVGSHDVRGAFHLNTHNAPHRLFLASISGAYLLLVPIIMSETRSSVLLARLAKKVRKETGDNRYRARVEDERASLRNLILVSCMRPIRMPSYL